MNSQHHSMRLYSTRAQRLYLNRHERERFAQAAKNCGRSHRVMCLILLYTGCRLSEMLNLRPCDFQLDESLVAIRSLKKRIQHHVREIIIPDELVREAAQLLAKVSGGRVWTQSRVPRQRLWNRIG